MIQPLPTSQSSPFTSTSITHRGDSTENWDKQQNTNKIILLQGPEVTLSNKEV